MLSLHSTDVGRQRLECVLHFRTTRTIRPRPPPPRSPHEANIALCSAILDPSSFFINGPGTCRGKFEVRPISPAVSSRCITFSGLAPPHLFLG